MRSYFDKVRDLSMHLLLNIFLTLLLALLQWRGTGSGPFPPIPALPKLVSAFVASFCSIAVIAALHFHISSVNGFYNPGLGWQWLIGSFGASAVLIYAVPESPLSQPRNLVFGHVGSAIVGVTVNVILPSDSTRWLACALSVSSSILFMQLSRTVHPPGGATALIAVTLPAARDQGYFYVIFPVLLGVLTMLLVALLLNNVVLEYPLYWWSPDVPPAPSAPSASTSPPLSNKSNADISGSVQLSVSPD